MKQQKIQNIWRPVLITNIQTKKTGLNRDNYAFTLVELIVVITILAILWMIAFISLQWYSENARDSVRISDIWNLAKTLEYKLTDWSFLPKPDDSINLTASWILFWYQGIAWSTTLSKLWLFNWWKDPLEENYYTYITNNTLTKYQVIWFLENSNYTSFNFNKLEAKDYSKRYIYTKWSEIWIILDSNTNQPITSTWTTIDLINDLWDYKVQFTSTDSKTWTGGEIFSSIYNRNKSLLLNKEIANLDQNLVYYTDMETTTLSWSRIVLKDLSNNWNNATCYNSWTIVDCWSNSWPQLVEWWWSTWKWFYFDWINDYILIWDKNILDFWVSDYSIFYKVKIIFDDSLNHAILAKRWANPWYAIWVNTSIWVTQVNTINSTWTWNISSLWYYDNSSNYLVWVWVNIRNWNSKNYQNGILKSEKSMLPIVNQNIDNLNPFVLWANCYNNCKLPWRWNYFYWIIDEIRVYNRALTDYEVKTLYDISK